jgi:hypothetical protein
MNYPLTGNISLGNVSGNIKLYMNDSGTNNLTGIGYNNNCLTIAVNQSVTATPDLVINPSGNVGIGTTTPSQLLEIRNPTVAVGVNTQMNITSLAGGSTSTNTSTLNLLIQGAGGGMVDNTIRGNYFSTGAGAYGLALNPGGTNVMNVISNGLVGIGTVNPQGALHTVSSGQNTPTIYIRDMSNSNFLRIVGNLSTGGWNGISQNNDVGIIYGDANYPTPRSFVIAPHANATSGIRMDTNGNVFIPSRLDISDFNGTIGKLVVGGYDAFIVGAWPTYSGWAAGTGKAAGLCISWNAYAPGNGCSSYLNNGQGTTGGHEFLRVNSLQNTPVYASLYAAAFTVSSDYRIKENIINIKDSSYDGQIDRIRPVYYYNTHLKSNTFGLIAHEVQEVYPDIVNGEKDAKDTATNKERYQSVDYTQFIAILIKEIQDLRAKNKVYDNMIQTLGERITALENK